MSAWTCDAHNVTTLDDCPRCDDELIALTEAGHEFVAMKDGQNEPTLWRNMDGRLEPVVRRCDLTASHRDVWPLIVAGVVGS